MHPHFSSLAFAALIALPSFVVQLAARGAAPPAAEVVAALAAPVMQRDASGNVTLSSATAGAVIRYSLDGADPGLKTGPYLAPIVLPAGGTVKARAFSEDRKQMSELAERKFEPLPGVAPQPATLVPCTQDRDWPTYDWAVRHAAVTKIAAERQASLVFIGDSITQMFGGEPHDRAAARQGRVGAALWPAERGESRFRLRLRGKYAVAPAAWRTRRRGGESRGHSHRHE